MKIGIQVLYTNDNCGNGSIHLINPLVIRSKLHDYLDRNNKGGQWLISGSMEVIGNKKTPKQMGYYRAEILPKALHGFIEAGYFTFTEYDAHEQLKSMFFNDTKENLLTGEIANIPRSLADADKDELLSFIDKCIIFVTGTLNQEVNPPTYVEQK
jgi:hypothetical protein